jgi:hypothetical protein
VWQSGVSMQFHHDVWRLLPVRLRARTRLPTTITLATRLMAEQHGGVAAPQIAKNGTQASSLCEYLKI